MSPDSNFPKDLEMLFTKDFQPEMHRDILYLPVLMDYAKSVKLPFVILRGFVFILFLIFLIAIFTTVKDFLNHNEVKTEGIWVTLMMLSIPAILLFFVYKYYLKMKKLQLKLNCNEIRMGIWITPKYLVKYDQQSGKAYTEISKIEKTSIYRSSKPYLQFIYCHINDQKQPFSIVSNWLGYQGRAEELEKIVQNWIFRKL